ncbi:peptidoglycan D,D-transpeptidase FtsI family protein [Streptomyces caatingaensis]|uniref:Penicillin-binding protein n=1 Tax=Streptomyces caatingaensis TaxID=1678637 RepID=A0A0K9XEZ3_9ACTN|nr:penicillin-binding transpeptidase domain-containing protein [Streptomyces caatingaensis]KNB51651.1 penicillin-binding protein [Streptomyces caatingaensis]
MNKPVRRVALFSGLLVLSLLVRSTWLQFAQADDLANNEHNRRVKINTYAQPRGDIIVGGDPVTGSTETTGSDLKYKRTYKDGPMYSSVTGYSSQIYAGSRLEYVYDKFLTGTDDRLFFQRTADMLSGKKPKGGDVVTTIDPKAQKAAYRALSKYKGAAVAIEPTTGKILAMVSTPSYDPSVFSGESTKDQKAWQKLEKDPDKPLSDRAIKELYPAGSTFKILTAAAALDHGLYTDINAPTDSPYPWNLPDTVTPMKNENESAPCRNASLKVAMQYSCNNVFAKIAAELGQDKMRETAEKFGFDKELFMPVSVTKSVYPDKLNRPQTALTGIGQGSLAATPFQIAMMTAALANDGKLMKPYLVDKLRAPDLSTVEQHKPEEMSQAVSPETAKKVQEMMEFTAKEGTGKSALIDGVTVGGKTGTAQHGVNNSKIPYAWFVSYAKQADGSPVAVAVFIDPEGSGVDREDVSGGGLAGPIAKKIMQAVLTK